MIKLWCFSVPRESKGWEWLRLACECLEVKDSVSEDEGQSNSVCACVRVYVCEYLFSHYFLSVSCGGGPAMHIVEIPEALHPRNY